MDVEITKFIKESNLFSSLTTDQIEEISPFFEKISISADTILFDQGSISDFLFILTKGELISVLHKPSGEKKIIGVVNPFETIGELSALSGEPRSLTVHALTNSELLKLSTERFIHISQKFPSILVKITKTVAERSLRTIKLIEETGHPRNISIILPVTQSLSIENLENQFKGALIEKNCVFISGDEIKTTEIKRIMANTALHNQRLFIFLTIWRQELFHVIEDHLSTIYLILCEDDMVNSVELEPVAASFTKSTEIKLDLILIHSKTLTKIVNTQKWLALGKFDQYYHVRPSKKEDFERLIRYMTGNAFVLVLGGGGGKGFIHLGTIKAVLEKNLPIDGIGGTSIGAAIGAIYIFSQDFEKTVRMVHLLKEAGIASFSWRNLTLPIISLYSANPVTQKAMNILELTYIEDLILPFFAVSSNLSKHKETIHRQGLLWEALRSSIAIPGIFPPVVFNGDLLLDGGLLNNLPVDIMREIIGRDHTILASSLSKKNLRATYNFPPILSLKDAILLKLHLTNKKYKYPPLFQTFLDSLLLGSSSLEEKNCLAADILVRPNLSGYSLLGKERNEEKLMETGYRSAILALEKHLSLTTIKS